MSRGKLFTVIAGIVMAISLVVVLIIRPWERPVQPTLGASQSLTYTNSITGVSSSDLPMESNGAGAGFVAIPGVSIDGTDALEAYLAKDQLRYVVTTMKHFLAAKSGLSAVDAGIQDRQILQSNNTLSFTLVADRPQAKYPITIDMSDSLSPRVTIGEAE